MHSSTFSVDFLKVLKNWWTVNNGKVHSNVNRNQRRFCVQTCSDRMKSNCRIVQFYVQHSPGRSLNRFRTSLLWQCFSFGLTALHFESVCCGASYRTTFSKTTKCATYFGDSPFNINFKDEIYASSWQRGIQWLFISPLKLSHSITAFWNEYFVELWN